MRVREDTVARVRRISTPMSALYAVVLVVAASSVGATEIRLFDPHVLGTKTTAPITPLLPAGESSIEPYMVSLDASEGRYTSASVFYPKRVALREVREALDGMYRGAAVHPPFGPNSDRSSMVRWRLEGISVVIVLWQEKCGVARVAYLGPGSERLLREETECEDE